MSRANKALKRALTVTLEVLELEITVNRPKRPRSQ